MGMAKKFEMSDFHESTQFIFFHFFINCLIFEGYLHNIKILGRFD